MHFFPAIVRCRARWVLLMALFASPSVLAGSFGDATLTTPYTCNIPRPDLTFVPKTAFDLENAFVLLLAARNTQRNAWSPELQWGFWGFPKHVILTDPVTTAQVHIASNDQYSIVVYRGTTTRQDYLGNALFGLQNTAPEMSGGVHFGFWASWQSLRKRVDETLVAYGRDKPVFFVGHSRGAALTTLQAAHWKMSGGQVAAIYAFAQPRLGDARFNAWLQDTLGDRYYRFNYSYDITPHVPPLADVVPELRNSGKIGGFLADTVQRMGYAPGAGMGLTVSYTGAVVPEGDPLLHELNYWNLIYARITDGNPLITLPRLFGSFPEYHDINLQICGLAVHLYRQRLTPLP